MTECPHTALEPGTRCTCGYRKPFPVTDSSPKSTKQLNVGEGPVEVVEEMKVRLDDIADKAGLTKLKYPRLKALDLLMEIGSRVSDEVMLDAASQVAEQRGWAT